MPLGKGHRDVGAGPSRASPWQGRGPAKLGTNVVYMNDA